MPTRFEKYYDFGIGAEKGKKGYDQTIKMKQLETTSEFM